MGNKGEITSGLSYEGSLPNTTFIDNVVLKDELIPHTKYVFSQSLKPHYGAFQVFERDLNAVRRRTQIMPCDTAELVNTNLSIAEKTLNSVIKNINDSYQEMMTQSKFNYRLSAVGLGLGVLSTIGIYFMENGLLILLSLGVTVTSATFMQNIYNKKLQLGFQRDYILKECGSLEKTITDNKSEYLAK